MMMMSDSDNEMSEMMQLLLLSNMSGAGDYASNFMVSADECTLPLPTDSRVEFGALLRICSQ